ncbi:hypothetical protein [Paenibacillus dendritiformis]|uniref:hypothetical protein n=1 Tax=Paenibacillus dendritiformis TaxID=130049 RepID=UPI0020C1BA80|nr:hypothetical protein [Paenibacillus dendritiformis]CAH8771864.1 hypothetical protein H7S4_004599 [Paenibacillus dendritiformis]
MEYADEKIMELLNKEQNDNGIDPGRGSVSKGYVKTTREIIRFSERELLNKKIKVHLPSVFEEMPNDLAALKYPSERRPNLILMSESTTINMAFNHTSTEIKEKDTSAFKDLMMEFIKKINPSAEWFDDGVKVVNGKSVGFFEVLLPALDTSIYNFMFCMELEGKALMCTFNCTEEEMGDWQSIAEEIMNSFQIINEGATKNERNHHL